MGQRYRQASRTNKIKTDSFWSDNSTSCYHFSRVPVDCWAGHSSSTQHCHSGTRSVITGASGTVSIDEEGYRVASISARPGYELGGADGVVGRDGRTSP